MKCLMVAALCASGLAAVGQAMAACSCGPDYCPDTAAYRSELASKKAAANANGAPPRLVALYDKLDHCVASIRMSPDAFNILRQENDGTITVDGWTEENERNDAAAVRAGTLKVCYVMLTRTAFVCCGGTQPEDRADYDTTLKMNKSTALSCE